MPTGVYQHKPIPPEARLKMSLASLGKKKSAEHIKNMSLARKGVKQSEETKRIRGLSLRGIPRTLCIDCHKTTDTYLSNYYKSGIMI